MDKTLDWLPGSFTIVDDDRDIELLQLAYCHGNLMSPDPSTKNGAILVSHDGRISKGFNGLPRGIPDNQKEEVLTNRELKYKYILHAEECSILTAARDGIRTKEAVLYCPFYACLDCAKMIITSGISRVVGHSNIMSIASSHTKWAQTITDAWHLMHNAGVECCLVHRNLNVTTRFNYRDIEV